ncbi:hypothetical protein IMZ48_44750 [Candidatus Bathyarchaeota archaeon]|nr:hypothetical protein [Candidatus Bathyarchaeota archaeon]
MSASHSMWRNAGLHWKRVEGFPIFADELWVQIRDYDVVGSLSRGQL